MIITPRVLAGILVFVVAASILQASFFSMVEVLGTSIWILPACATAFGLLGGRTIGAATAFGLGFLSDAMFDAPLGSSALALMAVGYLAGLYRERGDLVSGLTAGAWAAGGTILAGLITGLLLAALGNGAPLSWGVLSETVIQALYGFLLGIPIFLLMRRIFAAALVSDRSARRRRRDSVLGV